MITLPVRPQDAWLLRSALHRAFLDAEERAAKYFHFSVSPLDDDHRAYWLKNARDALEQMRVCHEATAL